MEDSSNPRVKKGKRQLTFTFKEGGSLTPSPSTKVLSFSDKISDSKKDKISSFNKKSRSIKTSLKKNSKSTQRYLSRLKKRISTISKKSLISDELTHIYAKVFLQIISNVSEQESIADFTKSLVTLDCFRQYETIQILIHKKGTPNVESFTHKSNFDITEKSDLVISSFNSIYSMVKKSKNKLFDQTNILKKELGVIGTFLAKEYDLQSHSIILIVSRNAFLPPSQKEYDIYYKVTEMLAPIISSLLEKRYQSVRLDLVRGLLNTVPFRIRVLNSIDSTILFSNNVSTSKQALSNKKDIDGVEIEITYPEQEISSELHHQQRVELLGELLNTLQHELSNPLFGLRLSCDLVHLDAESDDSQETIEEISSNCTRCQTIIKNFSRLYSGESNVEEINLINTISEVITLTKSESKQIIKNIDLVNTTEDITIRTNPTWFTQVIFNLIINSSQAIKNITDDFRNHQIDIKIEKSQDKVSIIISDTGPGINKNNENDIFKPFYTTKVKGTGLGLSICKNLSERLGGELSVINITDIPGASFQLTLPVDKDNNENTIG